MHVDLRPGDIITPPGLIAKRAAPSRIPPCLQWLIRSEVKPGIIPDRSGAGRWGVTWRREF
jgi:hypothetical protein